jgi:hypothetical protein
MTMQSGPAGNHPPKPSRFDFANLFYRVGRVMLVAVLFILFFWLAQSMVHHRFFWGGSLHRNGSLGQ